MESEGAPQHLNEYRFTTLRSLRECLKSYSSLISLARNGDFTSAAIMLDLSIALGDDPMQRVTVLTKRQKQAITAHLIRDEHVDVVAEEMQVNRRVVYLPRKKIAEHVGRSHDAVRVLIYRLRQNGETIERSRRRTPRSRQTTERRSA